MSIRWDTTPRRFDIECLVMDKPPDPECPTCHGDGCGDCCDEDGGER